MQRLLARLARFNDVLTRVALSLSALGLIAMTAFTGWQVFGRYVLNDSPQWVERLALLLVLYFTFLAGAVGVRERSHLGIEFISESLPPTLRRATAAVVFSLLAAFGGMLFWNGMMLVKETWDAATPILKIPEGVTYFAIPLGGVLMVSFSLELLLRQFADKTSPR